MIAILVGEIEYGDVLIAGFIKANCDSVVMSKPSAAPHQELA
jgi:hypothetical protein